MPPFPVQPVMFYPPTSEPCWTICVVGCWSVVLVDAVTLNKTAKARINGTNGFIRYYLLGLYLIWAVPSSRFAVSPEQKTTGEQG